MKSQSRLFLFLLALVLVAAGWKLVGDSAHEMRGVVQERLDRASPPLAPGESVGQTFFCRHDGLRAIEFLLVRYEPEEEIPASARIALTLERLDGAGDAPTRVELSAAGLKHNQALRFSFSPIPDSGGVPYRLTLRCNGDYALGFWTSSTEAYAFGDLFQNGDKVGGDLRFVTFYDYHLSDALVDGVREIVHRIRFLPALLLLLILPGLAMALYCLPWGRLDGGTFAGVVFSLSLMAWPLLLLWRSLLGAGVVSSKVGMWALLGASLILVLYRLWRKRGERLLRLENEGGSSLPDVALGLVLVIALATRFVQVRELAVPAWVDSRHHSLVTQMIAERGAIPSSFAPYMPVDHFFYHFGFHANAAVLTWLTNLSPCRAVLLLGQVLNGLAALTIYGLAVEWTERRWAGVVAAVVVGALSYMPAYYVSWGRYTQLAGLVALPSLLLMTHWLFTDKKTPRGVWAVAIVLAAGMVLTHYRVLIFYVLFWIPYAVLWLVRQRAARWAWQRLGKILVILGGVSLVMISPWAWRFVNRIFPNVQTLYGGWGAADEGYTSFPSGLLKVGWTRPLLYLAGAGVIWGLLRRRGEMVLFPCWAGLCLLVANLHLLGLPDIWLVHNESVVISFWMPMGVLVGWLAGDMPALLVQKARNLEEGLPLRRAISWALFAATLLVTIWGCWRMVNVLNPVTVLVTEDDLHAAEWIASHTPPEARFLVNARRWQGEVYVGTDGGYWLPLLAGRDTTMPCVFYSQGTPAYREEVNALAQAVEGVEDVDDTQLLQHLVDAGVTHVYVGAKGGALKPHELEASPHYERIYATGPAHVYKFVP
ncbi:MAG: DUF6541 family protein [Chloroflexota bacterium]|nr:DUF6541 family protein [Chloroflexota bacterium]